MTPARSLRRIPPALALFVIAPVFGELFSGSTPLNEFINPITFLTLALLYGCGAIIIRELLVRWQKGWVSLLLLGCAYGIYEEGLLVQSFFDPTWKDLGSLAVYGRLAGVNWVWAEHLTLYHAVISIAASIIFVEILYPDRRAEPWLSKRSWWVANWAGFIGVYAVWELMTTYNPGLWKLVCWAAILLLGLAARLAPYDPGQHADPKAPHPAWFGLLGFLGVFGQFFIVYRGADVGQYPFPVAMSLLAVYDLFILWLIRRGSGGGAAWDDRHRISLINGALAFFLVLGPLTVGRQHPVLYGSNPIFLLLLWWAGHQVNQRHQRNSLKFLTNQEG